MCRDVDHVYKDSPRPETMFRYKWNHLGFAGLMIKELYAGISRGDSSRIQIAEKYVMD